MCSISLAFSAIGTAFSMVSAVNQSKSQQAYFNYQAQVDRNNAQVAEWNAQDAIERGRTAEDQQRLKTRMLEGSQKASLAAHGLDISEGSALNMLSDTEFLGNQDALTIRNNAQKEAWGYRNQSRGYSAAASANASRASAESPFMAGATSLIASAGAVADKWYNFGGSAPSGGGSGSSGGGSAPSFQSAAFWRGSK